MNLPWATHFNPCDILYTLKLYIFPLTPIQQLKYSQRASSGFHVFGSSPTPEETRFLFPDTLAATDPY